MERGNVYMQVPFIPAYTGM